MTTKGNFLLLLPILCLLLFCNSCVSLSNMQSARTTPKGKVEVGLSALGLGVYDTGLENLTQNQGIYSVEAWSRVGVSEKVDIGLKLATGYSSSVNLDTKWQFLGDQQSFFAMGGGLGFGAGLSLDDSFLYSLHIPLYTSIHPTEKLAVFLNPKAIFLGLDGQFLNGYYGGSMGVLWGKRVKVGLETSLFHQSVLDDDRSSSLLIQGGIGVTVQL